MAASMLDDESTWVSLASKQLSARISPVGAQLSALRDRGGLDLLWNGDPAVWSGRAPFLFPIVGALAGGHYRVSARTYALPRHGFARGKAFEVVEAGPSSATFRLKSDESTLAVYPFRFELDIRFEIRESTLGITAQVRNKGDAQMPASFGYHPAFRWPLPYGRPRASHYLEFEIEEPAPIRRLNAQGLLTATRHPTPIHHRRLRLDDALFVDDALIMDAVKSRFVTYGADDGPRIRVSFPNTAYLGVWTKPQANFICIEPWHGVADPDGFTGDFTTKPGVFKVDAGDVFQMKTEITLNAGT
jgi:galactose mutarotase-like enzyme